jgi:DNA-binding transcriptional ArsR family regulator
MAKQNLDPEKLECMMNKLKALSHPARLTIVELLHKNGKMTVGDIQKNLKIEQAGTSNHLRVLRDQQILSSTRDGKKKYYSLRQAKISAIINCIESCSE